MMENPPVSPLHLRYWVPMLGHSFRVLEAFHGTNDDLSLQEVTVLAKITKTSAFRILFTLQGMGYLEKDPQTARYRLGRRLFEVAGRAAANRPGGGQGGAPWTPPTQGRLGETIKGIMKSYGSRWIGQRVIRASMPFQP